jgi:hypothetical protein
VVKNKFKNDIIRGHHKTMANIYYVHENRRKFKFERSQYVEESHE